MSDSAIPLDDARTARGRVVELEAQLATERELRAQLERKHDLLLGAYQALEQQLELIRRRLFVAKAERIDTTQLELEFAATLAALDALTGTSPSGASADGNTSAGAGAGGSGDGDGRGKRTPTGRRDLRDEDVPEERITLTDPSLDASAESIGTEEACRMMWRRASWVRVVTERIKYREQLASEVVSDSDGTDVSEPPMARIITAPLPPEMIDRSIVTASVWAHIASSKFAFGMPLYRLEEIFARAGFRIDRGTMSRWLEQLGGTVGATVVEAMRQEALRTAFCIATDATGIMIQPIPDRDQPRRACRRGHFFVQIADADHIFFEYTARETSAAVGKMFHGFSGYVQADAKSVYDFLFRPPEERVRDDDEPERAVRREVGCWSHLRTKAWEVAITSKHPIAREMLARIMRMFALDRGWKKLPHPEIKALRELHLRPHVDAFFAFVEAEYERVKDQRGLLRSALGYAVRQRGALTRFFDDGRLKLTNNQSERELRRVATGRKAWLFCGSDDHAQAAGNLLTLVASARLHGLDPEQYLRDLFRALPQWPRDRYIELAPKYWTATRARLDAAQLEIEIGWITIPPPPEQASAS